MYTLFQKGEPRNVFPGFQHASRQRCAGVWSLRRPLHLQIWSHSSLDFTSTCVEFSFHTRHLDTQFWMISIQQATETTQISVDRCMGKGNVAYLWIYTMEYYLALKKKENLAFFTTWMNLEDIILTEISQKDRYYMISLICGI